MLLGDFSAVFINVDRPALGVLAPASRAGL